MQEPLGSRAFALGQAYSALGDDVFAMNYNPATLSRLQESQAATQFIQSIADTQLGYVGFATPLNPTQAIGINITYLDAGKADIFGATGAQTGTVGAEKDFLIGIGYARAFDLSQDRFHLGLGGKVLQSTVVEQMRATAYAADLGGLYEVPWHGGLASLGLAVSNFGNGISYSGGLATGSQSDPLPLTARFGLSFSHDAFAADTFSAALQVDRVFYDNKLLEGAGLEYDYHHLLALRLGYRLGEDTAGLSLGMGLKFKDMSVDYAMGLISVFNNVQQVSFSYGFTIPGIRYAKTAGRAPLEVLAGRIQDALAAKRYFDAQEELARLETFFPEALELGRFKERIASEISAIVLRGMGSARYSYALGFKRYYEGNWAEGVSNIEAGLRAEPDNSEIRKYLSKAKKHLEEARSQLKLQSQARTGTLFELANQAFEDGDYSRAGRILNEILRMGPYQPAESLQKRIRAALEAPKPHPAPAPPAKPVVPAVAQPSPADQNRAETLYYEALRNYAENDIDKALQNLYEGLRLDPNNDHLKNTLDRIQRELRSKQGSSR